MTGEAVPNLCLKWLVTPSTSGISEDVSFFLATDDPDVEERMKSRRLGKPRFSWVWKVIFPLILLPFLQSMFILAGVQEWEC